jgi:predicted TPR repeat methyltransferase
VFDQFADTFDDDLNDLDYQGPQLLARVLGDRLPSADAGLDVLDAGCGTGLCGHVLRPYARYLAGVDLSESMIDKARCLNIYDDLVVDELTAFLAGSVKGFDLIACIDTLIYFGDLEEVLAKMTALLRDGGRLVVTCEASAEPRSTHGYQLAAHGRYGHTKPYVQRCLTLSGITNMVITEAVIRTEAGEAANGYVVLASKTVGRQP